MRSRWSLHVGQVGPAIAGLAAAGRARHHGPRRRSAGGTGMAGHGVRRAPVVRPGSVGTWFRLDPVLDGSGSLAAQRLVVGSGTGSADGLALDREAFAAGPFDGAVLVGTDDGTSSRMSLLDVGTRCGGRSAGSAMSCVARRSTRPGTTCMRSGWTGRPEPTSASGVAPWVTARPSASWSRSRPTAGSAARGRPNSSGRRTGPAWRSSPAAKPPVASASWSPTVVRSR